MKKFAAIAAAAVLSAGSAAMAVGPGTYSNYFPTPAGSFTALDIFGTIDLPQYSAAYPLVAVILELEAEVMSDVRFENENANAVNIRVRVSGTGSLSRPAPLTGTLVTTLPLLDNFYLTDAFDGVTDFGGTSGQTLPTISVSDTDSVFLSPADWAIFVGSGNVSLPFSLEALSSVGGGGNISSQISTTGRLRASVTYIIPEPASLGLLAPAGLLLARRRRA